MDPSLFGYSVEDFKEEAGELLTKAEEVLTALAREPENREYINALFRAIHSLKGSAAYAGLNDVNSFSHLYESFLGDLRNNQYELNKDIQKLLTRAKDYLEDLIFYPQDTHSPIIDNSLAGSINKLIKAVGNKTGAAETQLKEATVDYESGESEKADDSIGKPAPSEQEQNRLMPKSDNPAEMDEEDIIKLTLTKELKTFAVHLKQSDPDFIKLSRIIKQIEETSNWAFINGKNYLDKEIMAMKSILSKGQSPAAVIELRNNFNALAQAIKKAILSLGKEEEKSAINNKVPPSSDKPDQKKAEESKISAESIRGATEEDIVKITIT